MENTLFVQKLQQYQSAIEDFLAEQFTAEVPYPTLYASMRYSLLAGGKRIRPILTLEFARLGGIDWHTALPFACALEMVHTYSLIHDDLPCMDNDDLRRGKPTNHKVYGETLATLAGDALQPEAFRLLLSADLPAERKVMAAQILAEASGADGMVAGQVLDLSETADCDLDTLKLRHRLKTGAMICGAAKLGCAAAGTDTAFYQSAEQYAHALGMAFQIRDDLLDVIGDESSIGKPIGSDAQEGKTTFVDLLGKAGCQLEVERCTEMAIAALDGIPDNDFLITLAEQLAGRNT